MFFLLIALFFDLQANNQAVKKYNLWLDTCYVSPAGGGNSPLLAGNISDIFLNRSKG